MCRICEIQSDTSNLRRTNQHACEWVVVEFLKPLVSLDGRLRSLELNDALPELAVPDNEFPEQVNHPHELREDHDLLVVLDDLDRLLHDGLDLRAHPTQHSLVQLETLRVSVDLDVIPGERRPALRTSDIFVDLQHPVYAVGAENMRVLAPREGEHVDLLKTDQTPLIRILLQALNQPVQVSVYVLVFVRLSPYYLYLYLSLLESRKI